MVRTVLGVLGLVIAGGIFFLYTQPTYDTMQTLQSQNAEYDQALTKAAELQQLKQSLLSRYNSFNPSDINKLQSMLPDQVNNIQLILDLDNMASHDGMALQNVVINDPNAGQSSSGAIDSISTGSQKYSSLTMQFTTHGTYDQFKQFLDDMQSSLQVVDLVSLSIAPDTSVQASQPTYTYNMTIRTYWLN
jgi:Tfp pilus assembly protein PilO